MDNSKAGRVRSVMCRSHYTDLPGRTRVQPSSGLGFDTGLSVNSGLKMAKRGRTWGDSETAKLLELWSEGEYRRSYVE